MKQHFSKSLRSYGLAGSVFAAAGLGLVTMASPALAQDGHQMMGEHSKAMMGDNHRQAMMSSANSQGMMNDEDHRKDMMGADGHMMGNGGQHMMSDDRGMRGHDGQ